MNCHNNMIEKVANTIYDMAFGTLTTSYRFIESALIKNGEFELLMNQVNWIEKVMNRDGTGPSKLRVRVRCLEHNHITTKRLNSIICPKDSDYYQSCISCNNYIDRIDRIYLWS